MAMTYTKREHVQFAEDMQAAGRKVERFCGERAWEGPYVYCYWGEFQDVCRETSVKLQRESRGLGYFVYPLVSM